MTQTELLNRVRQRLRDTVGSSDERLWSDEELIDDYGNAARDRLFILARHLIVDSTTPYDNSSLPLCTLPVIASTSKYALSQKILDIHRAFLSGQTRPLRKVRADEVDTIYPNWQNADAGEPWGYCADMDTDSIILIPKPVKNYTATLTVSRYPLKRLAIADKTILLDLREEYQEDLIPWILSLAFLKKDAETDRPDLAEYYRQKFIDRAQDIKLEVYRRYGTVHTNLPRRPFLSR